MRMPLSKPVNPKSRFHCPTYLLYAVPVDPTCIIGTEMIFHIGMLVVVIGKFTISS